MPVHSFPRACLVPLAWLALALPLSGQLDLPGKPKPRPDNPGREIVPGEPPRGDLAPRDGATPLDLPAATPVVEPAAAPVVPGSAARALFAEIARTRDLHLVEPALEHLLALGPEGLAAARAELGSTHPAALLLAGRACLMGGSSADRAGVAERLTRALPAEVCSPLLAELLVRDPVLASPEYLSLLLDHPTNAMRTAATKTLEARLSPALLPALAPLLAAPRTATRGAALDLVARIPDTSAYHLLVSRLGDTNAQLARRAAGALALRPEAEDLLAARAFPPGSGSETLDWDRARAYALLGLVECQEARGSRRLDESHIETLRAGLASEQPLIAGACAVALAHIGHHLPSSHTGAWLDREVPHQLVRTGTGALFHPDFSSLERPALRALALLSGESFGDGEAWRRWWVEEAAGFRAVHSVIDLVPEAGTLLGVALAGQPPVETWLLVGSAVTDVPPGAHFLLLEPGAADELLAAFLAEGLFGAERPAVRARAGARRALTVSLAGQSKSFQFASGPAPEWFERVWSRALGVIESSRWQLYFDPSHTTQRSWWLEEHERWSTRTPLEARRELKNLVLAALGRAAEPARNGYVDELEGLYGEIGVSEPADLEPLLGILSQERSFGPRAERLCELARIAAGATGGDRGGEPDGRKRLLALGLERFGQEADGLLARIARDLDAESLQELARSPDARARALAAGGLLRSGSATEHELVLALLADPAPQVELAVLQALSTAPFEEAREALTERARKGAVERRVLALRALARLGGEDVLPLALEAMGEGDEVLQRASVEVMATLADPRSASLLASLLARGPASPLFASARLGLKRLGARGLEECQRLARSANARTRREATLLLSEACMSEAAGPLLTLVTEEPSDEKAAWELAVLSGVDNRQEEQPEVAWWDWWDLVVHDDSLVWLLAAAERAGVTAPARGALEGGGTAAGARFLLTLLDTQAPHLVERAARELERRLEVEFTRPASSAERGPWRAEIAEAVRARFGE